jgi:hypothetical protein
LILRDDHPERPDRPRNPPDDSAERVVSSLRGPRPVGPDLTGAVLSRVAHKRPFLTPRRRRSVMALRAGMIALLGLLVCAATAAWTQNVRASRDPSPLTDLALSARADAAGLRTAAGAFMPTDHALAEASAGGTWRRAGSTPACSSRSACGPLEVSRDAVDRPAPGTAITRTVASLLTRRNAERLLGVEPMSGARHDTHADLPDDPLPDLVPAALPAPR